MNKFLFRRIDNSALVAFRIIFGLLITLEAWGAIVTGWVRKTLVEPIFTFNFIGLDFLQPLPGNGMYFYFAIMGCFGVLIMLGFKYRFSIIAYTVMWTAVYLMQKTSYNNHYYLLILLLIFMSIVPAHRNFSIDAKQNPELKSNSMPQWVKWFLIFQIWIVYTYAALAKIYPDWLDGTFPEILMKGKSHYYLIGDILQQEWVHTSITYFGILFDLLVVPLLLWKRTRVAMFWISVFFHLFNSIVFQIGIFPYMSLAFILFFFPTKFVNRKFLRFKPHYEGDEINVPKRHNLLKAFFIIWFSFQIFMPMRHHFIKGDVFWTEEGHRMSWRMMLRSKSGYSSFKIKNNTTGKVSYINMNDYLTAKQRRTLLKPDAIWQFTQRLKEEYEGEDIEIYARVKVSLNGRKSEYIVDPNMDLSKVEWHYFSHNPWILSGPRTN
ncbi:HTTM domain-containing protein [Psychroflexus aestuariivivens]|uniref:HTTM domain-containing protein n=1 Tax=Psychroflexus aestuariivivens TaxID=1795040 RepID=UPI000FD7C8BD|nr:HTTM domain-containing protein [Psychroflexus aestuariivivens]